MNSTGGTHSSPDHSCIHVFSVMHHSFLIFWWSPSVCAGSIPDETDKHCLDDPSGDRMGKLVPLWLPENLEDLSEWAREGMAVEGHRTHHREQLSRSFDGYSCCAVDRWLPHNSATATSEHSFFTHFLLQVEWLEIKVRILNASFPWDWLYSSC